MKKFILGFVVALVLCGIAFGVVMFVNNEKENLKLDNDKILDEDKKEEVVILPNNNEETEIKQNETMAEHIGEKMKIKSIEKDNNSYIITANLLEAFSLNEEEYKNLITNKHIVLGEKEFYWCESEENEYGFIRQYEKEYEYNHYIYKENNKYYFTGIEIGGSYTDILTEGEEVKIYLDDKTKVEQGSEAFETYEVNELGNIYNNIIKSYIILDYLDEEIVVSILEEGFEPIIQ